VPLASSGPLTTIAAGPLPRLTIDGNRLMAGGGPVVLRGLNLSGLQHRRPSEGQSWRTAAGLSTGVIAGVADAGARIIRLPLSQDWVLGRDHPQAGEPYLQAVDELVGDANRRGMYAVLCLHVLGWRPTPEGPRPFLPPMPDEDSVDFWRILADRFRGQSGVLFDLLNEPHPDTAWQLSGRRTRHRAIAEWHGWTRRLHALVQARDAERLMLVSGIGGPCWSSDLSSFPVRASAAAGAPPLANVIYASHLYRHGGAFSPPGWHTVNARAWRRLLTGPAAEHPVMVSEWGAGATPRDARWSAALVDYLESLAQDDPRTGAWRGLAGWLAWSFGDAPHVVDPAALAAGGGNTGSIVRWPLTAHGRRVVAALAQSRRAGSSRGTSR